MPYQQSTTTDNTKQKRQISQFLRCQLFTLLVAALTLGLTACTLIQPPTDKPGANAANQGRTAATVTSTPAVPISEEERIKALVEASVREIFTPTQPYSGTLLVGYMGAWEYWADYDVTAFDRLHSYVRRRQRAAIYECEQNGSSIRILTQLLPTNAVQPQSCNLPFQLFAQILPSAPELPTSSRLLPAQSEPPFSDFVSLGRHPLLFTIPPTHEKSLTRLADGYQFQVDIYEVELWLDAETQLPILLKSTPPQDSGLFFLKSFAFLMIRPNTQE